MSQQIWQTYDQDDLIRLVEQGLGWTFLPRGLLSEKLAMGTLIEFFPEFNRTKIANSAEITWRSNLQHGPVATFIIDELIK